MIDWRSACAADDLAVKGREVVVSLPDGRRHRVRVEEDSDGLRLTAKVAMRGALGQLDSPELFVWLRNRSTSIVGFHFDSYGGVFGEALAPAAGLEDDEFRFYVRAVARECDRLEALLTGDDVE